jgi:LysR family glycine cleavage system transcriptional activator
MDHSLAADLPPLDPLRAFEAAARTGSFSAAAGALNITHGAVSRQIGRLEHWVGLRLFDRRARGVVLTPEGQRLFQRTGEAFALLADTAERWSEARGAAVVRLASVPSVSGLWLMPRLNALETAAPAVRAVLLIDHRQQDLDAEGIDLAIRCGRGGHPSRISLRLFEEHCYPVAAPAEGARIGQGGPERLMRETLIHDSDGAGWRAWFAEHGLDYRPKPTDRRFEDYNLVLEAAANGLGVALARPPLVARAMTSGRLAMVDARTALNPVSYWLDRPRGTMRPAARALAGRIAEAADVSADDFEKFARAA